MGWLHVARIPGNDSRGAWLVVPGIHDPLLAWAMAQVREAKPLSTFGGWLVPMQCEDLLWGAIAQTHGTSIICPQCWHEPLPCEAWINLVTKRFEEAHAVQQEQARWNLPAGYPYDGNSGYPRIPGYKAPESRPYDPYDQRYYHQRDDAVSREKNRSNKNTNNYNYSPPKQAVPKPKEPTKQERIASAVRILGVAWPATKAEIKKAFALTALRTHPDVGGNDKAFIEAKQARDLLTANV